MPHQFSQFSSAALRCLRSMPKAPQRYPRRLNKTFQAAHLPRDHSYSTLRPSNPTRGKANYKLAVFCSLTAVAATWAVTAPSKPERLDASPRDRRDSLTSGAKVEITGKDHGDDVDKSSTGTSTVPYFPRTIWLPRSGRASEEGKSPALPAGIGVAQEEEEYKLLGLGIRKVSFLRIQVYVVGLYVAKSDIGRLQEELVRASVGSGASTLVQGEKQELRKVLLDGDGSMKIWSEVLKKGGVRSAVRVVPTRNTNFSHLRDGWLRGIDLRGKGREFEGEDFQAAVDAFKGMLGGRGSVGKGKVLLLGRGADGALRAWAEDEAPSAESPEPKQKAGGMSLLGTVKDERISRLVWMGYLTGENVASEEARQSVVNGVMEIVERPVGTVETQVV